MSETTLLRQMITQLSARVEALSAMVPARIGSTQPARNLVVHVSQAAHGFSPGVAVVTYGGAWVLLTSVKYDPHVRSRPYEWGIVSDASANAFTLIIGGVATTGSTGLTPGDVYAFTNGLPVTLGTYYADNNAGGSIYPVAVATTSSKILVAMRGDVGPDISAATFSLVSCSAVLGNLVIYAGPRKGELALADPTNRDRWTHVGIVVALNYAGGNQHLVLTGGQGISSGAPPAWLSSTYRHKGRRVLSDTNPGQFATSAPSFFVFAGDGYDYGGSVYYYASPGVADDNPVATTDLAEIDGPAVLGRAALDVGAVTAIAGIEDRALVCTATGLEFAQVATAMVKDLAITSGKIADDAVTAAKLADTTVTAAAYGSATQVATFTVDAQGRLTAAASVTATPAWGSVTGKPSTFPPDSHTHSLAGDVTGTTAASVVEKIQGTEVSSTAPTTKYQILKYDPTISKWGPWDMAGLTPTTGRMLCVDTTDASGYAIVESEKTTSVIGNPTGSAAKPIAIQATADGQYLQRKAGALVWDTLSASPFLLNKSINSTPGSSSFTVPAGVTRMRAVIVGAGGAQGGMNFATSAVTVVTAGGDTFRFSGAAGPGGGGAAIFAEFDTVPGESLSFTVGAKGTYTAGAAGTAGGNTTLTVNSSTITAQGGGGGTIYGGAADGGFPLGTISGRNAMCVGIGGFCGGFGRLYAGPSTASYISVASDNPHIPGVFIDGTEYGRGARLFTTENTDGVVVFYW